MTVSPDAQGAFALISLFPWRPERLLAFDQPGFVRGLPASMRAMVLALILSSSPRMPGGMWATSEAYSATQRSIPALR